MKHALEFNTNVCESVCWKIAQAKRIVQIIYMQRPCPRVFFFFFRPLFFSVEFSFSLFRNK